MSRASVAAYIQRSIDWDALVKHLFKTRRMSSRFWLEYKTIGLERDGSDGESAALMSIPYKAVKQSARLSSLYFFAT